MLDERESPVLITTEACNYLRISRPTYLKHLATGKIKGIKVGKGWKVLKSELNRFLREKWSLSYSQMPHHKIRPVIRFKEEVENGQKVRGKKCLKCGHRVILERGFFLCGTCRNSNSHLEDLGAMYQSYLSDVLRTFRLGQHG